MVEHLVKMSGSWRSGDITNGWWICHGLRYGNQACQHILISRKVIWEVEMVQVN